MDVKIKRHMNPEDMRSLIRSAQQKSEEEQRSKKKDILQKMGGMLSHLKKSPLEIQKELRDGWLE